MDNIKPSQLYDAIASALAEYSSDVTQGVKDNCKQAAKDAVSELKQTSPKRTGEYGKGWKTKTNYESEDDIRISVYNGKKPQITHLLENGHVSRNGTKRTFGTVKSYPHIAEAEQHVIDKLGNMVKVAIKKA